MIDLQLMCDLIISGGAEAFCWSFSAKSISEDCNVTIYQSRKSLKALREYGIINRTGNRYMFTLMGWQITNDLIRCSQRVVL